MIDPQFRAMIATAAAGYGINISGDSRVDLGIIVAWVIGGIADWIATRRRRKASASTDPSDVQRRLREGASKLPLVFALLLPLAACGASQSEEVFEVTSLNAACDFEATFTLYGQPLGVLVLPECGTTEGSGDTPCDARVCVLYGEAVFCGDIPTGQTIGQTMTPIPLFEVEND